MKRIVLLLAALGGACRPEAEPAPRPHPEPTPFEVRLEPAAARRLGIETVAVRAGGPHALRWVGAEVIPPSGRVVTLDAPTAGRVQLEPGVRPGATFEAHAPLLRLTPLAPADRDTAARAHREVRAARANLDAAEARLERTRALAKGRAGSQRALEEATANRDIARADLDAARRRARAVRTTPLLSDLSLSIEAPERGTLRTVSVASGQTVASGTPLVELVDTEGLWVRAPVASTDLERLEPGAAAQLKWADGEHRAPPVNGPPTANPSLGTVDRYFALEDDGPVLGERVLLGLPLRSSPDGRRIPASAVLRDPSGSAWLYTSDEDGHFRRVRIELLRRDGADAVLRGGPAVGTRVVSVGAAELYGAELGVGH